MPTFLIVIAPGVERFDYFRRLAQVMAGALSPSTLLTEQERYETFFDQSDQGAARKVYRG